MVAMPAQERVTPEEYLARERVAETKSEYLDGEIAAMTGASRAHSLITVNVTRELSTKLKERPCEVHAGDMRVKAVGPRATGYLYPDVAVVCGQPDLEDAYLDTLLNPVLIVEVLSPSTEGYNRGEKFARYRTMRSLHDYVLISPDRIQIEVFTRQEEVWVYREVHGADNAIHLPSVDCDLTVAEVYHKVAVSGT